MVNLNIPNYVLWISLGSALLLCAAYFIIKYIMKRKKKEPESAIQTYDDFQDEAKVKESLKNLITKSDMKVKPKKELTVRKKKIETKAIPEKEMQPEKFYYESKPFEYFDRSRLSLRYWLDRRKAKKYPSKVVLVRFEMNNGRHREFIVKEEADGFIFNGDKYTFDIDNKYYIIDSNIWAYDFHEGFALSVKNTLTLNPELTKIFDDIEKDSRKGFKRKIPTNLLRETMEASNITEIENAFSPKVQQRVSDSQFVQMILQGATLGKLFKILLILVIIALVVVVADLVIDFISSGLIDEIGLGKKE